MISFSELYTKYANDVFRYAFYLSGSYDDAHDICSDTFLKAWTTNTELKRRTIKSYLLTIARHLFLQKQAKNKRTSEIEDHHIDQNEQIDNVIDMQSEINQIFKHLKDFSEIDRSAFILRIIDQLSYQEIAETLELTTSAVKVKIHRIRKYLNELKMKELI